MTSLKIVSHHHSLAAAVESANPDLSYNLPLAKQHIRDIDANCRQAVVVEGGDIYYVFQADIDLLHKFSPFVSCLSDSPFRVAFIVGDLLSIGDNRIPKTKEGRNWFKTYGKKLKAFAA